MDDFRARDVAWQLAVDQLPVGSPLVFQWELEYQEYFYFLISATRPAQCFFRLVKALLSLRPFAQLKLIRTQLSVLRIAEVTDADSGAILGAIQSEHAERMHYLFGVHYSQRAGAAFDSLSDQNVREEFADQLRRGLLAESSGGFECYRFGMQVGIAASCGLGVFAWLMLILYNIGLQGPIDKTFLIAFITGSFLAASWTTFTMWSPINDVRSMARRANAALGPRAANNKQVSIQN